MLSQYNKKNYLTYNKSVTPINFLAFKGTYLSPSVWSSYNTNKNNNTSLELLPKTFITNGFYTRFGYFIGDFLWQLILKISSPPIQGCTPVVQVLKHFVANLFLLDAVC